jgi:hypothetical protein
MARRNVAMAWEDLIKAVDQSYAALPAQKRKAKVRKIIKTSSEKSTLKRYFPKLYKEVFNSSSSGATRRGVPF